MNRNTAATLLGLTVAIASAWITIDWANFKWTPNNAMMLFLSGVIAAGGFVSSINKKKDGDTHKKD